MPVNKERALEVIEFIQLLHLTGDFYGKPFVLQDWQHEVLWKIYGTVKEDGTRQYQYAYLEIPKKNGKTELTAGLGLYHIVCDGPGGQIYCCAAEREQAALVYRAAKQMIEQDDALNSKNGGILKVIDSKKEIHNTLTGTFLKVLSAEAYSKHGINPTVVIFDELHAQPNRDLWDVMTFGAGAARREPLWLIITTAGDDPDRKSIGWEQHEYAREIIAGTKTDPTWCAWIYGAPDDADIYDEKVWAACNPSLGVTIPIEKVREEAIKARNSEKAERLFRWLRLNQWVSVKRVGWLPLTLWDQTTGDWSPADLLGKRCYVGIDLARTIDLTGIACLFPPQEGIDRYRFTVEGYIPEDKMKERIQRDHVPFDQWLKGGYVHSTPGDVQDYRFLAARIDQLNQQYDVQYFCGDPWQLEVLRQQLPYDIADKFIKIDQTKRDMSPAMHEMERLFHAREISHLENPLGRWCFGNVIIDVDGNENMKPMKNRSIDRIDPIVALINAMAGAIKMEPQQSYLGLALIG